MMKTLSEPTRNPSLSEKMRARERWEAIKLKKHRTAKALAELEQDEMTRAPVPNRAALRKAGFGRGRKNRERAAQRLHAMLNPATEAEKDRYAARQIVAADRRQRLLLDVPIEPRPAKLNKYGRVESPPAR